MEIKDLLEDIKAYRNTMVARNFPHQEITNLIIKWDQKLLEDTPEYKQRKEREAKEKQLEEFKKREQEEQENLERISKEAREEDLKEMAKQWPEYTLEELKKEQALADDTEKFKEKDEN